MLLGRKLPGICDDFAQKGVMLNHLYTHLTVPMAWLDKEDLFNKWQTCIKKAAQMFNTTVDTNDMVLAFAKASQNDSIDFGLLDETLQKTIISRALSRQRNRHSLIRLNPHLLKLGDVPDQDQLIQKNMKAVLQHYNMAIYRETLADIYQKVLKRSVVQRIDKHRLLSQFFKPETMSMLNWSEYIESSCD